MSIRLLITSIIFAISVIPVSAMNTSAKKVFAIDDQFMAEGQKLLDCIIKAKSNNDPELLVRHLKGLCDSCYKSYGVEAGIFLLNMCLAQAETKLESIINTDNYTVLHWAASDRCYEKVVTLLLECLKGNAWNVIWSKDRCGQTAMHLAACRGCPEAVSRFIKKKATPEQADMLICEQDDDGWTPLELAMLDTPAPHLKEAREEVVRILQYCLSKYQNEY